MREDGVNVFRRFSGRDMAVRSTRAGAARAWPRLDDQRLLDLRFCDLGLAEPGAFLQPHLEQVWDELAQRGLRLRPHAWLSTEWFSPDGVPGVALPFYLAHPRLLRLEKSMMLEAEGGTREECLAILRHEFGHCMQQIGRAHV